MSGTTPEELSDLADALTESAQTIDQLINSSGDPFSPQGKHLKDISTHIGFSASQIRAEAVEGFAAGVAAAVTDLTGNIKVANGKIAQIQDLQKVLSVAAALLSVAAAVVTKDPLAAVSGVSDLIGIVQGALTGT